MRLPYSSEKIVGYALGLPQIIAAILERRRVIRKHRDQKMDDRCWLDDHWVWEMLDDTPDDVSKPSTMEEGMKLCRDFFFFRRGDTVDPTPPDAILDPAQWDEDVKKMSYSRLFDELCKIQQIIFEHRSVADRPRTIEDDRQLYRVLPEKLPADFRLPPKSDFLGEAKAPAAGCPSFWRSHAGCPGSCNLHTWGPCSVGTG